MTVAQRAHSETNLGTQGRWNFGLKSSLKQRLKLLAGLDERDASSETSKGAQETLIAAKLCDSLKLLRNEDVGTAERRKFKIFRQHSDNSGRLIIERNGAIQCRVVFAKACFPQSPRNKSYARSIWTVIVPREVPAGCDP